MKKVMIKKVNSNFEGYNEPHQCHKNSFNYCYDNYSCKFVVGRIFDGCIPHCIVQLQNGEYIDPTLNEEREFEIDYIYSIDEIMKIFSTEQMYFFPTQWTLSRKGEIFKYEGTKRIVK